MLFLSGMLSFLRRLDGPDISAEVSTTVSGKGGFLDGDLEMLSLLRRLDEPGSSADVSTTVSGKRGFLDELSFLRRLEGPGRSGDVTAGKGRFLDEDSTPLDSGKKEDECLAFGLEEKIWSISDMVAIVMNV